MILRSRIRHSNVISVKVRELSDRVEVVVECLSDKGILVNKHRIYGRLNSFNSLIKDNVKLNSRFEVRFENPISCLLISIDTDTRETSQPCVSIQLSQCNGVITDKRIDEMFSYSTLS